MPMAKPAQSFEKEIEGGGGLARFGGNFYVSDYYHFAVDVFGSATPGPRRSHRKVT